MQKFLTLHRSLMLLLILSILWGSLLVCSSGRFAFSQTPPQIYPQTFLSAPFLMGQAKLALCAKPPLVLPIEGCESLYLLSKGQQMEIADLHKLRGHVHINTADDALAYVRLKTSPITYHVFYSLHSSFETEIIRNQDVTPSFLFGINLGGQPLRKISGGYYGIVSSREMTQLGCPPAQSTRHSQGYLVTRTLLSIHPYSQKIRFVHAEEWVGRDGQYIVQCRRETPLKKVATVDWQIPTSE